MITPFKRIVAPLSTPALLALLGLGCRTAQSFSQVMVKAGKSVQKGTK